MAEGALSHIRVLDLSRVMAAPWCTQILADLGADVIKIERPGEGDDTRGWGPPFLPGGRDAGYFLACNRGKRSVTVDMAAPEGQAIIRRLAESSDVCVENFKVGALARYGLDAASLRAINPRLVYCSVTGFGQSGPRAGQAAYDFAIQAMGGLMSITGERDDAPGGGPQKVGVPVVDMMTGMYATVGILAALERRNITGVGETIDIAMLDVQAAFLSNQSMNFLMGGRTPTGMATVTPMCNRRMSFPARTAISCSPWAMTGNSAGCARRWATRNGRPMNASPPTGRAWSISMRCARHSPPASPSSPAPRSPLCWERPACPQPRSTTSHRYSRSRKFSTDACCAGCRTPPRARCLPWSAR